VPFRIPLIRTSWLPGRIVGLSLGVAILLDPRYFYDEPTIRHELIHCRQFWRNGLILHFLRYWLSKSYRLHAEVEAFREELAYINESAYESQLGAFATALSESYGLSIGQGQAKNLLDINPNNLG
jgi:hypothetical protein